MERRSLVVGNWKMHGTVAFARELAREVAAGSRSLANVEVAICPPHLLLSSAAAELVGSDVKLGAQTVSEFLQGAYTGETSASMLNAVGCRFAIVGHSERRHLFGETSDAVAAKATAALEAGITPIICVGEVLEERQSGATNAVVAGQLRPFTDGNGGDVLRSAVIAYEPVWAIGTGEVASPEQAQAVHAEIRSQLGSQGANTRIIYGGSVNATNAGALFAQPDIDGGLVGGASLEANEFLKIAQLMVQG